MIKFELPDMKITAVSSIDQHGYSGDDLPFEPFSDNDDELEFSAFG